MNTLRNTFTSPDKKQESADNLGKAIEAYVVAHGIDSDLLWKPMQDALDKINAKHRSEVASEDPPKKPRAKSKPRSVSKPRAPITESSSDDEPQTVKTMICGACGKQGHTSRNKDCSKYAVTQKAKAKAAKKA
jgi:hypothetical protein